MDKRKVLLTLVVVSLIVPCAVFSQKASNAPPTPNKSVLAQENVKELLLLMDTDKNGKISKQEWMHFMSAEFDRLDADKSGELDPKELTRTRMSIARVRPADQGK